MIIVYDGMYAPILPDSFMVYFFLEVLTVIVEGFVVFGVADLFFKKEFSLVKSFGLSLIVNVVSAVVGLCLLPFLGLGSWS